MSARPAGPPCLLFDNGSLRPESTRMLRTIARALAAAVGADVRPVSLLHSSVVDPRELDGRRAELLEPTVRARLAAGETDLVLLPLFFGPSGALTDYLPRRLGDLRRDYPRARLRVARWLVDLDDPADTRVAAILADRVRATALADGLLRPRVVLVDHGSPERTVTAVRDLLGRQLAALLGDEIASLAVTSMERRAGAIYDFCEPTLERWLDRNETGGPVVVALQFLLPGRHAGTGGDVAAICARSEQRRPGLELHVTETIGSHPAMIEVLVDRYRAAGRDF